MPCLGNNEDHCCYVNGVPCEFLEENSEPDRHWTCGLRRIKGNWNAVEKSKEYQERVKPVFDKLGINCKDWPDAFPQARCMACGLGIDPSDTG